MTSRLKVGVLGGAGFIGRRLVARLAAGGHEVRVGDIVPFEAPGVEFHLCDVTDSNSVYSFVAGLDVLYNLAAEHRDNVSPLDKYEKVNVGGASVVCESARRQRVRHIRFTSSVAVYGLSDGPTAEDAPCQPFNEYGRTKWRAEGVYRGWVDEDAGRSLAIIRPTVVFGEGNRGNVYHLARQVSFGRFIMVGSGVNKKSLAYVDNVVDFMTHLLCISPGAHVFNYSDGPDFDMNHLVSFIRSRLGRDASLGPRVPYSMGVALGRICDAVARVTGRPLPVSAVRVRKFCAESRIVAARARLTGFRPAWTLEDALERFLVHEFPGMVGAKPERGGP